MQIQRVNSPEAAVKALCVRLLSELQGGKQVLWLVSGGSNLAWEVAIMQHIPAEESSRLTVMLIDERVGAPGHPASNWQQLQEAGFEGKQAHCIPTLVEGETLAETVNRYEQELAEAVSSAEVVIAQLGLGTDGHIAGILPHSPASAETKRLVCGYETEPYTRLTVTFPLLRQVTAAYLLAFGADKQSVIETLLHASLPVAEQPAQALKSLPEAYLYTDQEGESA